MSFRSALTAELRSDAALYLVLGSYVLAGLGLADAYGWAGSGYGLYTLPVAIVFGVIMPGFALAAEYLSSAVRGKGATSRCDVPDGPDRLARMVAGIVLMLAMSLFFDTFTTIKNLLPVMHGGFPYDRMQADLDAFLHLGRDPWRLLQPLLGYHAVRVLLEFNYDRLWFLACYGALFIVATSPAARGVRVRYVMGFMMVWIVAGNLLAGLFLSAGPAFYGDVTGDTARFADQLAFLRQGLDSATSAAFYQSYLWTLHGQGQSGFASGISAFPSVHVALVAFNAFFLTKLSRRWAVPAFLYVSLIGISSVYLGWHYAIDGYAGFACAWLVHKAVWSARLDPRPVRRSATGLAG